MNRIPVCRMCLEPITNFICPGCLYKAVQQWLWKNMPRQIENFRDFHEKFIDTCVSEKTAFCIVCKKDYYHMICSYDYISEVHDWLEDFGSKEQLEQFLRIFGMGLGKIDNGAYGRFFYRNLEPSQQEETSGFCENCENFSDSLKKDSSKHMVCEDCR